MGFPILVRWHLYIELGPWPHQTKKFSTSKITELCFSKMTIRLTTLEVIKLHFPCNVWLFAIRQNETSENVHFQNKYCRNIYYLHINLTLNDKRCLTYWGVHLGTYIDSYTKIECISIIWNHILFSTALMLFCFIRKIRNYFVKNFICLKCLGVHL